MQIRANGPTLSIEDLVGALVLVALFGWLFAESLRLAVFPEVSANKLEDFFILVPGMVVFLLVPYSGWQTAQDAKWQSAAIVIAVTLTLIYGVVLVGAFWQVLAPITRWANVLIEGAMVVLCAWMALGYTYPPAPPEVPAEELPFD